jgi:hypothetical protein
MKRFWERSKREKVLILASFAILLLVLGHYFLIVSYLQHREWVKNQLEIQPQLLEKNRRFIDRKVEIESGLQSFKFNCTVVRMSPRQSEIPWINAFRGASTSGRPFNRRNPSKM